VLINWREVTNGSAGISGVPKVSFFGLFTFNVFDPNYIAKVFDMPTVGRLLQDLPLLPHPAAMPADGLRDHAAAPHAGRPRLGSVARGRDRLPLAGHQHHNTKLTAFAIGAMFGGFAGSFFAARQGFVSPESFVFIESAIILAIVVLGGMGSLVGIAVAAR
jgi:branched-chain amino acid transport system permease protein